MALVAGMEVTSRALYVEKRCIQIVAAPVLTLEGVLVAAGHQNCHV